jgi:hypothetical protein
MMNLTNVQQKSSDQHQEAAYARQKRDCLDTNKLIDFLPKANPFKGKCNVLRNIVTGVAAFPKVNADVAKAIGNEILLKMDGKSVQEFIPRKADQCILMTVKGTSTGIDNNSHVDPALLFQRLVTVARRSNKEESSYRAMKGEVSQLHKKISLGLRHGFSKLRPRLTLSHPPTFGIFGNSYDDGAAI